MASLLAYQPFKGVYALLAVTFETVCFPMWLLLYITASGRPNKKWTLRQAIGVYVVKTFLYHSSAVKIRTPLSLKPGREGKRWAVMSPAPPSFYKGPLEDKLVKPITVGGTWTPSAPSGKEDIDVVLYFHGGGYVIGHGRDTDAGFAANTLVKHGKFTHVFAVQYRLASNPDGQFPAAFQDAVTSYVYLLRELKIPASRITFSGDSAGANLALTLLRYVADYGKEADLPWPGAIVAWSPWVNVAASLDHRAIDASPKRKTDYLCGEFGTWAARKFSAHHDPRDPYLSPLDNPFKSESPIFIQTGDSEVLYYDDVKLAKQFQDIPGNKVELVITEHCPHDIILIGHLLGFAKEAQDAARRAGDFVRANRRN